MTVPIIGDLRMQIDIRFDENMNRSKYFVIKKKPNKKIEIFEIRTEDTKRLDFIIMSYAYSIENADCIKNLVNEYRRESKCFIIGNNDNYEELLMKDKLSPKERTEFNEFEKMFDLAWRDSNNWKAVIEVILAIKESRICNDSVEKWFKNKKDIFCIDGGKTLTCGEELIYEINEFTGRRDKYKILRPDGWKQFKVDKKKTLRFTVFSNQNDLTLDETERVFLAFKKMYPNLKTIIPNFVHNWPGIEKGTMKAYWL